MKTTFSWRAPKPMPPGPPVDPLERAIRQAFDRRIEAMPDEFLYGPEFSRANHTGVDADPTWRRNLIIAFYDHALELLDPLAMEWADARCCTAYWPTFALFRFWVCAYPPATMLIWEKTAVLRRLNQTHWAFRLLPCEFFPEGTPLYRYSRVIAIWDNEYGDRQPDLELRHV